jgi:hypothetical protein
MLSFSERRSPTEKVSGDLFAMLAFIVPDCSARNISPSHFLHGRINRREDRGASYSQIASENSQRFIVLAIFFSEEVLSVKEKECSMKL